MIVTIWFFFRHSSWTWFLQDIIAVAIAMAFLTTTRVSSLKQSAYLLGLFFLYDVFMTFVTPVIFNGRSVMVEVAKGMHN